MGWKYSNHLLFNIFEGLKPEKKRKSESSAETSPLTPVWIYRLQLHFLPRRATWQPRGSPRSDPTQEKKHVKSIGGHGAEISVFFDNLRDPYTTWKIPIFNGKVQSVSSRFVQLAFPRSLEHTVYRRIKWYGKITESSRRFQQMLPLKSHNP